MGFDMKLRKGQLELEMTQSSANSESPICVANMESDFYLSSIGEASLNVGSDGGQMMKYSTQMLIGTRTYLLNHAASCVVTKESVGKHISLAFLWKAYLTRISGMPKFHKSKSIMLENIDKDAPGCTFQAVDRGVTLTTLTDKAEELRDY
ncbi:Uncharacterized protein Fot_54386 [Forsythia ovata]|uniref:Uncharacterized protein n=1 Tax=Forsythia ovata TaxID=205694 RepID=A0ABD1P6Z2_9LAMI